MVHGALPEFVNTTGTLMWPAAPVDMPVEIVSVLVVQAIVRFVTVVEVVDCGTVVVAIEVVLTAGSVVVEDEVVELQAAEPRARPMMARSAGVLIARTYPDASI